MFKMNVLNWLYIILIKREGGCISSDEMYQDVEVVIAYILCLEEKENNLKEELRKIYKRKGLI